MQRQDRNGLASYHFDSFPSEAVVHAVFTRLGGISQAPFDTLNLGSTVGDDPAAVAQNHMRVHARLDLSDDQVVTCHQVHSNRVAVVSTDTAGQVIASTDGLATGDPRTALMLRFADCQPILFYDPVRHALALIHAGWRGVAQGIALRAVETLEQAFGSQPGDLKVGLGPAIGPCCYTVGDDVAAAMGYALPDWSQAMERDGDSWRLDLPAANAQQLKAAGVQHIEQAGLCTSCRIDEFFSHRAERGRTGRFGAVAYLTPGRAHAGASSPPLSGAEPGLDRSGLDGSLNPPGFPGFEDNQGDRR